MDKPGRVCGGRVRGISEVLWFVTFRLFQHLIQCGAVIIKDKTSSCMWLKNKTQTGEIHLTGKYNVHE